jgi:hypothetical protein
MANLDLGTILHAASAMSAGGAAASGWTASVIVANTAFDGLDPGRADRHLRKVLVATASFQAILMAIAAGCAILSGATAAMVTAVIAALGFLSNMWTLAPRKDKAPEGLHKRNSTMRIIAVSLTLIITLVAATSGVLAALGI